MHELVENEEMEACEAEKVIRWEALRDQVNTIGARDALDRAMRGGHVLFDYLWFLIVVSLLLVALTKLSACSELDTRSVPVGEAPKQEAVSWLE